MGSGRGGEVRMINQRRTPFLIGIGVFLPTLVVGVVFVVRESPNPISDIVELVLFTILVVTLNLVAVRATRAKLKKTPSNTMRFRKLRIAWSVFWGVACVL